MIPSIETERLLLRPMIPEDVTGLFEMDSDLRVAEYLGGKPMQSLDEARKIITYVQEQYERNGVGRWTVVLKDTNEYMGWCGLKLLDDQERNGHTNFYDIGYRFIPRYWKKGYGFEAAQASLQYGFTELQIPKIIGMVHDENQGSCRIMEKLGLRFIETFYWDEELHRWYEMENPSIVS